MSAAEFALLEVIDLASELEELAVEPVFSEEELFEVEEEVEDEELSFAELSLLLCASLPCEASSVLVVVFVDSVEVLELVALAEEFEEVESVSVSFEESFA